MQILRFAQNDRLSRERGEERQCCQNENEGPGTSSWRRSKPMDKDDSQESQPLYCPRFGKVVEPLVCGDCGAVICRQCGTALEPVDELGIG